MLPTKAKIAAFVCSGRRRPKVSHDVSRFAFHDTSCMATVAPSSSATRPHTMVASEKARTIASS